MRNIIYLLLVAACMTACQRSLEEKAADEAREYTRKNCPFPLNETIVMDSMAFDKATHTFFYYYKIQGKADTENLIDPEEARKELQSNIRNTTSMKAYKDAGYNFRYIYHSASDPKKTIIDAVFTPKDYQ